MNFLQVRCFIIFFVLQSLAAKKNASMYGNMRIHAGLLANYRQFGFMAALDIGTTIKTPKDNDFATAHMICSGSILTPRLVLTAAHCLHKVIAYSLVNPGLDISAEGYSYSRVTINITAGTADLFAWNRHTQTIVASYPKMIAIHLHPKAIRPGVEPTKNMRGKESVDLMVLRLLKKRIVFDTPYVRALQLVDMPVPIKRKNCLAMGFGNQKDRTRERDGKLYYLTVDIGDWKFCNALRGDNVFREMNICAYATGKSDSCSGDSGSPLVCGSSKHGFYSVGVLSFGKNNMFADNPSTACGETETSFGVYVYPGYAKEWLLSISRHISFKEFPNVKMGSEYAYSNWKSSSSRLLRFRPTSHMTLYSSARTIYSLSTCIMLYYTNVLL